MLLPAVCDITMFQSASDELTMFQGAPDLMRAACAQASYFCRITQADEMVAATAGNSPFARHVVILPPESCSCRYIVVMLEGSNFLHLTQLKAWVW